MLGRRRRVGGVTAQHPEPDAGIEIRPLASVDDAFAASDVLARVWGGDRGAMPPQLLRAMAHAGSYTVGLWDDGEMIGASVAFFGAPTDRTMHSHITGVLPGRQGRGIGRMLKQHQREWALEREVGTITWTFDPLVRRNAHFNFRVLGVRAVEYLVNHYGAMDDGVNRGDETDRILVAWSVASPAAAMPEDTHVVASVEVPADIETLRRTDPDAAREWRIRVREQMQAHIAAGRVVGGFDDTRGYLLVRS